MPGTYLITPVVSGLSATNYTFTPANGMLTINSWTTQGFFSPVDMGNVYNTVKSGQTVPLKFRVFAGAVERTDTGVLSAFTAAKVSCSNGLGEDAIEELVASTGGTVFRYDTTGGQFIYNWKTSGKAGDCYRVTAALQDGSKIQALFKLK